MQSKRERGFTLIELGVVVLLMGIVLGFSIPAFLNFGRTNDLKAAADNMASQIRLARERAMSTSNDQHFHFSYLYVGYNYAVHPNNPIGAYTYFKLPRTVTYSPATFGTTFFMYKDGRASASQIIKLVNAARQDTATVSVEMSGLVTVY